MLRGRLFPDSFAAALGAIALTSSAYAQPPAPRTIYETPLRGSVREALAAVGDRVSADRGQFLLEFIRRVYDLPSVSPKSPRQVLLNTLLAHLNQGATANQPETIPLPLHPDIWVNTVFAGRADKHTLVSSILSTRESALLYYGLLALDDDTRAWFAGQPELLAQVASKHAAAFVIAAPGLRIRNDVVQAPGGEAADRVWQALIGQPTHRPDAFIRALLTQSQGRLAYFFGAIAHLTPPQLQFALRLNAADPAESIEAARRLSAVFDKIAEHWEMIERPFWRPALDPALLVADLASDQSGTPILPGTRAIWTQLIASDADVRTKPISTTEAQALTSGPPVDFPWLCEQVFKGGQVVQRRPYEIVLFVSRVVRRITPENAGDAIDTVRATTIYPALMRVLERAGVTDIAVLARAARHARQLATIGNRHRAHRALAQFQGSLVILTRAALRGSVSPEALSTLVASLSTLGLTDGAYDGQIVRWWRDAVHRHASPATNGDSHGAGPSAWDGEASSERYADAVGSLDRDMVRLLAGRSPTTRTVDWEGTRYRVDPAWAEVTRLGRMLGTNARPYLSSASALVDIADAITDADVTRAQLQEQISLAEQVQRVVAFDALEKAVAMLKRAESAQRSAQRASIASTLRGVADDLAGRGLVELVYATALGQPEGARISAADAAARHDFGLRLFGFGGAWRLPVAGSDRTRDWHVTGALLALDVRLADLALARVSSRPPLGRPTVNDTDRRVLIEAVALVEAHALSDEHRDTIVAAMQNGRARLAAARTPTQLAALADDIRMIGARRSLLAWTAEHDPGRLGALFSPSELLWLGLEGKPVDPRLNAWGAPGEPRLGCLCLQMLDRRPWEAFAGRWDSGILASTFPDLNLRLTELLAPLQMPAALLPAILASATVDLINGAASRNQDDRRGLVDFVQSLDPDRVELYLAMLTTDGPLVPLADSRIPIPEGPR